MFGIQEFHIFLTTAIILNITPGADTIYIIGRSVTQGRLAGVASVLGISTGSLVHTLFAATGLSALLLASAWAFTVIKFLGAGYLIYLGLKMLLTRSNSDRIPTDFKSSGFFSIFRQGFYTNILNPKVALFFLALVPQFISLDSPSKFVSFIILGLSFVITGTIWCLLIVLISTWCSHKLKPSSPMSRFLNRVTGGVFIGLGVKVAATN